MCLSFPVRLPLPAGMRELATSSSGCGRPGTSSRPHRPVTTPSRLAALPAHPGSAHAAQSVQDAHFGPAIAGSAAGDIPGIPVGIYIDCTWFFKRRSREEFTFILRKESLRSERLSHRLERSRGTSYGDVDRFGRSRALPDTMKFGQSALSPDPCYSPHSKCTGSREKLLSPGASPKCTSTPSQPQPH